MATCQYELVESEYISLSQEGWAIGTDKKGTKTGMLTSSSVNMSMKLKKEKDPD